MTHHSGRAASATWMMALLMLLVGGLASLPVNSAKALEAVTIAESDVAVDLGGSVTLSAEPSESFQVSSLAGADGIVRRIEVRSVDGNADAYWAVFALSNGTDRQLDRLIVAPHYRLVGSGVVWPDLGSRRIVNITPSEGFALEDASQDGTDIYNVTLNPGSTITFIAELKTPNLPKLELWSPEQFKERENAFTLFKGIVLGISGLLAMFLTVVFLVRGTSLFPATAALAWAVLAHVSINFGFLTRTISVAPGSDQVWRAGTEVALAMILVLFLFSYLRLNRWNRYLGYLSLAWTAGLGVLAVFSIVDPPIAAGLARISVAITVTAGLVLIITLGLRGFDRAIMLVPTWIMLIAWLVGGYMTAMGEIDNDVVEPALSGLLVLVVVLLGFTVMQHAFSGGMTMNPSLFSDAERKALALTGAGDTVWDWDVTRDIVDVSPDISEGLGYSKGRFNVAPRDWLEAIHPDDRQHFRTTLDVILDHKKGRIEEDIRLQHAAGHYLWFQLRARPVIGHDGEIVRCVGTMMNVTERKLSEERLLRDAVSDKLTGLPNREILLGQTNAALALARKDPARVPTILVIDIDRFRLVNDSFGQSSGDTLLLTLSKRIARHLQPEDVLCRLNGDTFAILVNSEFAADRIATLAESLRNAVSQAIEYGRSEIVLTCSIGLAKPSAATISAAELLKDAELAMYQAKRFGGDRIEPYRPAFRAGGEDRLQVESDLRRALERGEIRNFYQPIIELKSGEIKGFEALMRWEHPRRGMISPTDFIPIAESTGLIVTLGAYVMQSAAQDLKLWQSTLSRPELFVSVNLSSLQVMREDLVGTVQSVLSRSNIDAPTFKLELTESLLMEDPERAVLILKRLRNIGVGLSIDDFGTGHSSLAYLSQFPFDTMKIDRSFFIDRSARRDVILKGIMRLGTDLGMTIVAEGVEEERDVLTLRKNGCSYLQSFAYGEPRRAESVPALLKAAPATEKISA